MLHTSFKYTPLFCATHLDGSLSCSMLQRKLMDKFVPHHPFILHQPSSLPTVSHPLPPLTCFFLYPICSVDRSTGADMIDCCVDSLSGLTSQPSMGAIVNALSGTELDTGVENELLLPLSIYWWVQCLEAFVDRDCRSLHALMVQ